MKTIFIPAVLAATMLTVTACNSGTSDETSSDTVIGTTSSMGSRESDEASASTTETSSVTEGSYVNLATGKTVQIKKDEKSGYAWDATANEAVEFYISPATKDTFDRSGRIVNNYILHSDDGKYMIDETKWKMKTDSDGDIKMKDGEGNKIKYDASSESIKAKSADGSKEKLKDDKYKSKTDTSKTVIRQ